jgi:hypothetical protein
MTEPLRSKEDKKTARESQAKEMGGFDSACGQPLHDFQ